MRFFFRRLGSALAGGTVAVLTTAYFCSGVMAQGPVDPDVEYPTGLVEDDPGVRAKWAAAPKFRSFLPVSVDLQSRMPAPGDQGQSHSCTAWAMGYAARSYYVGRMERRDLHSNKNIPSPRYLYHAGRSGHCEGGSSFFGIARVLEQGSLSLADYPFSDRCQAPPSPDTTARAGDFQIEGLTGLGSADTRPTFIEDVKGQLNQGHPVVFSFKTPPSFHRHRGAAGRTVYSDASRDIAAKHGRHAMTFIGYDDRRQAFRLINSWGKDWGDGGYAWLSYDMAMTHVTNAVVLRVKDLPPSPPSPAPEPAPSPELDFSDFKCAGLRIRSANGEKYVDGYVGSLEDYQRLMLLLIDTVAKNIKHNYNVGNVLVAPWPQCEALQTLETALQKPDVPKVELGGKKEFLRGDTLTIRVTAPSHLSYIYVAYIQADGSVVHLAQPQGATPAQSRPGQTLTFGDGLEGRAKFTIDAPYGFEMVVVLASRSPLFSQPLPKGQDDRSFLSAVRRALIYKSDPAQPDRDISAAIASLITDESK
jgi:Domain of unknown function (DUF4384)/Papain family cysteine protease